MISSFDRWRSEEGQALPLVVIALTVLLAAVGLAMDSGQFYVNFQKAQAAADAAAQAGIMSIYNGTNTGASNTVGGAAFTCGTADTRTPCVYARMNRFGANASDTVSVAFSGGSCSAPGVTLSSDPVNLICVTAPRTVNTSFSRIFGTNSANISAVGVAAITLAPSPVPILVTHPTLDGALSLSGHPTITITGGPRRSIQVNSSSASAFAVNGSATADLSAAGPNGTGADLALGEALEVPVLSPWDRQDIMFTPHPPYRIRWRTFPRPSPRPPLPQKRLLPMA